MRNEWGGPLGAQRASTEGGTLVLHASSLSLIPGTSVRWDPMLHRELNPGLPSPMKDSDPGGNICSVQAPRHLSSFGSGYLVPVYFLL